MKPFYISLKPFLNHGDLARPTDWATVFGHARPVEVEIGFGNGEYLARMCEAHPLVNWVGFEQYCERIHRTLRKLSRRAMDNVRVLRLDARAGFEWHFSSRSITRLHCLYPPPWPKKSDAKHRLFTAEFLKIINNRLVDGGTLKIVTDHRPYVTWVEDNIPGCGFTVSFNTIAANYNTKFENKWVGEGQSEFYELILTKFLHQEILPKEDVPVQTYVIDKFEPEHFCMASFSKDGIAVVGKDFMYDPKRQVALVHALVVDDHVTQHVRVVIARTIKGWQINLAEGTMLMPTAGVAQAVTCVHQAALASVA